MCRGDSGVDFTDDRPAATAKRPHRVGHFSCRTWSVLLAAATLALPAAAAAQQSAPIPLGPNVQRAANGVLAIAGFAVVPDGTASAIQIDRGVDGDAGLTLGQFGAGFTWSEGFPLYLEGFIGYARYDPKFVASGGTEQRAIPTRWNTVTGTVGIGWDFALGNGFVLRPILNAALANVSSDAGLFGALVNIKTDRELDFLDGGRLNAWGLGGSLMFAWYDKKPEREIDIELRYTQIHLESFGGTSEAVQGTADAGTASAWGRVRWPTGLEAFGRPVRWVIDGTYSQFLLDTRGVLGFNWLAKVGGGIELDLGKYGIGPSFLELQRVRLMSRYVFGVNVRGWSVGLGVSF